MKNVKKFYDSKGWSIISNNFKDAELFEDLRDCAKEYVSSCRLKILNHIPVKGDNLLDFASGPIQYKEYLKYSRNFKLRHCVDFSKDAINQAKKKIGIKGRFYCNDFLKLNFKENYFDCIISLHTLYHIEKKKQTTAINKLLKILKKDKPLIIVYSNPETIINKIKRILKIKSKKKKIYFYCYNLEWWKKFSKIAVVKFYPWRSFSAQHQKMIFPNNILGKVMFIFLSFLEKNFPQFFVKNFQYPIIVLTKK